jgi:diacylglycerol kinase (ATP)
MMRNKFLGTGEAGYHPLRKIKIVLSGLRFAVLYDFSVAYKMVLSAIVLALALIFQRWVDFELILLATGLVLMAELFNSAIEAVCDFLETHENEKIRAIKDIAAAAVGISIVVWLTVVISDVARLVALLLEHSPG